MADEGMLSLGFARSTFAELVRQLRYGGAPYRRLARTAVVLGAWLKGTVDAIRMFGFGPIEPVGANRRR